PPLVVLCDISGSMERYSRILLHFVFALARSRQPLHAFLFGTRLTPITRTLRRRDVDAAYAALGQGVPDWSGGTRIGACLHEFNRRWSRRVLAQGAVVILISDGLERDDPEALDREAARLRRSCQRLIWLNPLLGYEDFEPLARGIRALLGHVDDFRPVHNLVSLEALARALTPAA
ncbi:MAG: VWA domain-containing protein, partial [Proteobacteria bacterium]|nr:VWA domain-containing protein [Pseudomonadota bacterium]